MDDQQRDARSLFSSLRASFHHTEKLRKRIKEASYSAEGIDNWTRSIHDKFRALSGVVDADDLARELEESIASLVEVKEELDCTLGRCIGTLEGFAGSFRATIAPPPMPVFDEEWEEPTPITVVGYKEPGEG